MKKIIFALLIYGFVIQTQGQTEENDYNKLYLSYPKRLFVAPDLTTEFLHVIEADDDHQNLSVTPTEDNMLLEWQGVANKKEYNIQIRQNSIAINDQKITWNDSKKFPNESTYDEDFFEFLPLVEPNAMVYFSKDYICLEKLLPYAVNRWNDEYYSIYLIKLNASQKPKVYKLPSLLNSCLNIRIEPDNSLSFFKLDYWYLPGKYKSSDPDAAQIHRPQGIIFTEYQLKHDKFQKTNKNKFFAKFLDPYDIEHFIIIPALDQNAIIPDE